MANMEESIPSKTPPNQVASKTCQREGPVKIAFSSLDSAPSGVCAEASKADDTGVSLSTA